MLIVEQTLILKTGTVFQVGGHFTEKICHSMSVYAGSVCVAGWIWKVSAGCWKNVQLCAASACDAMQCAANAVMLW